METKNNKELCAYVQPETEEVKIECESVIAGFESGVDEEEEI